MIAQKQMLGDVNPKAAEFIKVLLFLAHPLPLRNIFEETLRLF